MLVKNPLCGDVSENPMMEDDLSVFCRYTDFR
jgi:hypothetical protein